MRWAGLGILLVVGCGGTPATTTTTSTTGGERPPVLALDVSAIAAPIVELRAPTSDAIVLRGALLKGDAPTEPWDASEPLFGRAFCIGETCFSLVDRGARSVEGTVTAVGEAGACRAPLTGARLLRAHLDADAESGRPPVEQSFVVLEVGACADHPSARAEAIFGAASVEVFGLRDASWAPADGALAAQLEEPEERTRALYATAERVPIFATEIAACGITLARGLAVYWIHEGTVNQPFDAARFVRAGDVLYAFSAMEGLDPFLERLDRVRCGT